MSEFTSESLQVLLTVIGFGILVGIYFWGVPQFTNILIQAIEGSVI